MSEKNSTPEPVENAISLLTSDDDEKNEDATTPLSSESNADEKKDKKGKKDKKDEREHPSSKRMHSTSRSAIIGQDMRTLAVWALRFILVTAAAYILYKLCQFVWVGLLPTILAIIVCSALWPPVRWLINHKVPSWLASLGTLLLVLGTVSGILSAIAPSVASQVEPLSQKAVQGVRSLQDWLLGPPFNINQAQVDQAITTVTEKIQSSASQIASVAINGVSTVSSAVVTIVITLVLCFFFLKDGSKLMPWVKRVVGMPAAAHIEELSLRYWSTLGGFIRTQGIVSAIDATFIGIGMVVLGVPLAGPLALITFMGGFVPIIGALVSGFLAVVVATVGVSVKAGIIMLVIILVVQQLEGNVLSPLLQSNAMDLHPVIVLLAVSAGGTLYGIMGAFLAVPCAAIIAVTARYIVESWDERAKIVVEDVPPSPQPETKMARWLRQRSGSLRSFVQDGHATPGSRAGRADVLETGAAPGGAGGRAPLETGIVTPDDGDDTVK